MYMWISSRRDMVAFGPSSPFALSTKRLLRHYVVLRPVQLFSISHLYTASRLSPSFPPCPAEVRDTFDLRNIALLSVVNTTYNRDEDSRIARGYRRARTRLGSQRAIGGLSRLDREYMHRVYNGPVAWRASFYW